MLILETRRVGTSSDGTFARIKHLGTSRGYFAQFSKARESFVCSVNIFTLTLKIKAVSKSVMDVFSPR